MFLNNLPLIITVLSALAGAVGFFVARVRKNYGLERDIRHLQRDYKSLSGNVNSELQELERRLDGAEKAIAAIKGFLSAGIAKQFDLDS